MKILLILGTLAGLALAVDPDDFDHEIQEDMFKQFEMDSETVTYYHSSIGIPMAEMMREYEDMLMRGQENGENVHERIIGGQVIKAGVVPFIGGLNILLTDGNISMCGSSLLTNTRSLTAAHCWYDGEHQGERLTMVHGSATIYYGGLRTRTKDVTMHEDWDHVTLKNDIALIKHVIITFTPEISPILLPTGELQKKDFANVMAQAAGYGLNKTGNGSLLIWDQPLRLVKLKVLTNKNCGRTYGNHIYPTSICTRNPKTTPRATCSGDSGGPLFIEENAKKYVIGITSFSYEGCELWPSVFTRVTEYINWIESKM